ncbi:hypothetical protein ACQPZX_39620 [Actinoplanes sp. CA-142083]|uniref:hypothetical protein n=1 Tax=Actinoplanes sp. CA-142083 TaxID=3239903 RepID=UPI003D8B9125
MTAPGNSALVFTLLAVFLACSGYAAGRLHQRYQMERDREEAYRDGYDTATRSIFSLAARLVAPRRGTRPTPRPVVDGALVPEPSALPAEAVSAAEALADPALIAPAALSSPALADPALADQSAPVPAWTTPASDSVDAPMFWPDLSPSDPKPSPGPGPSPSPSPGPGPSPGNARLLRRAGIPGASPVPPPRRAPTSSPHDAASLGFPVPPRPPSRVVGEPAAYGGVVYRPFPDPRLIGNAEPLPADRGSYRMARPPSPTPSPEPASEAASHPAPHQSPDVEPAPDHSAVASSSSGRHTVPEELVQAETYRLPPDRVFRAKVPEPAEHPALTEESTTRLWVPKPRQS